MVEATPGVGSKPYSIFTGAAVAIVAGIAVKAAITITKAKRTFEDFKNLTPVSKLPAGERDKFAGGVTLRYEHVLATLVAVLIGATAIWYGGNPPEITAAISVVTWWAIAIAITFGLVPLARLDRIAYVPLGLLTVLVILTGVSFFWSNNEGLAFNSLVQITGVLGIFALVLLCSRNGSANAWLRGIAFGLAFLVLLSVMSRFFPGLGDDTELAKSLYGSSGRLSWPLGYWNAMASIAAMATVAVAWFGSTHSNSVWRHASVAALPIMFLTMYLTSSRGGLISLIAGTVLLFVMESRRKGLLIAYAAGILGGAILVLSASQMPDLVHAESDGDAGMQGVVLLVITIAVSSGTFFLMKRFEDGLKAIPVPRPTPVVWAGLALAAIVAVVLINPIRQADSFIATPDAQQVSIKGENLTSDHLLSAGGNGRWQYWEAAINAFKEKPAFGIGAGSYQDFYTNDRDKLLFGRHTHSLPLRFLGELGLIGFLLAAGFFAWVVAVGWRRWRAGEGRTTLNQSGDSPYLSGAVPPLAALILTGTLGMSIDWTSEFPAVAAPILIAMAAIVGPATRSRSAEGAGQEGPDALPKWGYLPPEFASVIAVIGAGAAIFLSTYGFGISHHLSESRDALVDGNTERAISEAQDAVNLAPWSAGALTQLSKAQESGGQFAAALNSADRASEQAPLNSTPWFARYRIFTFLNDKEAARDAIRRARQIDPHAPFFELGSVTLQGTTPVPPVSQ